jgi:PEGA domain
MWGRTTGACLLVLSVSHASFASSDDEPLSTGSEVSPAGPSDSPKESTTPANPRVVEAEEYRQRALRFYDSGNFAAAREEFLRANHVLPNFRLLYNLGVVSMALGDSASAYEYFERYLVEGGDLVPSTMQSEVRQEMRDLAENVASVDVSVDVAGAELFVDDDAVGKSPLGHALRLNAGTHRVSARASGFGSVTRTLKVAGRDRIRVQLELPAQQPAASPADASRSRLLWIAWSSTAALAVGTTFAGIAALSTDHAYDEKLGTLGTTRQELDAANAKATRWSVTADVLGAAAIAGAIYSLSVTFRHPSATRHASVWSGPGFNATSRQAAFACTF